jgi:hypothetical protein
MKVQEIESTIYRKTEELELAEEFAEMKANPPTGPVRPLFPASSLTTRDYFCHDV